MSPSPLALSPVLPSELLSFILSHQAYPTTLIICQRRRDFLASLALSIQHDSRQSAPPTEPSSQETIPQDEPSTIIPRHSLLIPSLYQIATSRYINLVFVPTVSHLRAYMAVFPQPRPMDKPPAQKFDKPRKTVPLLVVYGLVELHRDTSEWSAQGLANSISALVDAGERSERKVVVVERKGGEEKSVDRGEAADGDVGRKDAAGEDQISAARRKAWKCWEERVPMLNGSVRRTGLESEGGGWSGRTVEVGRTLQRWFKIRRGEWDKEWDD